MAALCQMARARDDSAYRYGASFCGSTICPLMAFSIPQIQWALPSFRFSDFCCQFCRRSPSSWVKGTQTACPSCLDSSYFDSDGTFLSFSFSSQREHFAEDLFAHSFWIETRAWGPPVTDRETTAICVQMMTSLRRDLPLLWHASGHEPHSAAEGSPPQIR